jgi:FkbM family methyltransferase
MKFGSLREKLWKDVQIVFESVYPRNTIHALLLSLDASKKILADQKRIQRDLVHLDQGMRAVFDSIHRLPRRSGTHIQQGPAEAPASDDVLERLDQIIQNQYKLDNALLWLSSKIDTLSMLHHDQLGDSITESDRRFQRQLFVETCLEINKLKSLVREGRPHSYGDSRQQVHEERLIESIFPLFQDKILIDVGAHRGEFFSEMLDVGFEAVHAIEPHPALAAELETRFGSDTRVRIHALAMADRDEHMDLHVASSVSSDGAAEDPLLFSSLIHHSFHDGLEFNDRILVSCRTLKSMTMEGLLPEKAGLLKIDSEGFDLRILHGMPDGSPYEMIMSEYWGKQYLFSNDENRNNGDVMKLMEAHGYPFSIHVLRDVCGNTGYTMNQLPRNPNVWGNSLYFRDSHLFHFATGFMKRFLDRCD